MDDDSSGSEYLSEEEYNELAAVMDSAAAAAAAAAGLHTSSSSTPEGVVSPPSKLTASSSHSPTACPSTPIKRERLDDSESEKHDHHSSWPLTPTKRPRITDQSVGQRDSRNFRDELLLLPTPSTPTTKRTTDPQYPLSPQPTPQKPKSTALPPSVNLSPITINRAPVLCLWTATVAIHEGYDEKAAFSIGKAIMSDFADRKAHSLGLLSSSSDPIQDSDDDNKRKNFLTIPVFGLRLAATQTSLGLRALTRNGKVADDLDARWYVRDKFGARFEDARRAMAHLAAKFPPEDIGRHAYRLYEEFRPSAAGWGGKSALDLRRMVELQ
ncbi:hypothetical protein BDZ88DRAFT_411208 [Geranomyces variabilis]|nr:hypothetical protein BDZ88DRAFT_411208 [Geranomyces variabilis]KAJ3136608.1 hypothetical protein HDU90_002984 [Geranomyces variabilis]